MSERNGLFPTEQELNAAGWVVWMRMPLPGQGDSHRHVDDVVAALDDHLPWLGNQPNVARAGAALIMGGIVEQAIVYQPYVEGEAIDFVPPQITSPPPAIEA